MTMKKKMNIVRDIDKSMKRLHTVQNLNTFMEDDLPLLQVACYLRVSTLSQHSENQLIELLDVCNRNKWQITEIYEETISGTKGVDERYELNRMMHDACRKKFDKVVVWSVDRLGRSMKHLVSVLSQLDELNVDVFSYVQGIDTSTQFGKSMFQMVGIFAELENNMRADRQRIGIKRALDNGAKFGRKSIMNDELIKKINNLREEGHSMRNIANECDVSTTIVQKAIKNTVRNTNSRVI
jgi:DNA invertase Pin-like site-specific DNA recombinase|tara:strand:- start:109 stop:825 length:717 start_codon:yes stop_codon:yes gene_type:complete